MLMLIGAGALVLSLIGGGWWMYETGQAAQKETDRPKIEKLNRRATLAEEANLSLQTDLDGINVRVATCNARVDGLSSRGAGAKADIAAARSASDQRAKLLESRIAHLQLLAATPTTGSAEEKCAVATRVLDEVAERMRTILGITPQEPAPKAKVTIK